MSLYGIRKLGKNTILYSLEAFVLDGVGWSPGMGDRMYHCWFQKSGS